MPPIRRRTRIGLGLGLSIAAVTTGLVLSWDHLFEKRFAVVEPGKVVRGAWQKPGPLRRILAREKIRTIVSLTAINPEDPKFVEQAGVVREAGVDWIIVPMKGSRATIPELAEAADLIADPARQPVFFHCVAGHHRSNQVHAAYLMRHKGVPAEQALATVARLPWTDPDRSSDRYDRGLIEAFGPRARVERPSTESYHALRPDRQHPPTSPPPLAGPAPADPGDPDPGVPRVERVGRELRDGRPR